MSTDRIEYYKVQVTMRKSGTLYISSRTLPKIGFNEGGGISYIDWEPVAIPNYGSVPVYLDVAEVSSITVKQGTYKEGDK